MRGVGIGGVDYSIDDVFILPVKLGSFSARENNCITELNWVINSADNLKQFEIEKSRDGHSFFTIGTLLYTSGTVKYNFTDAEAGTGNQYYRLRMADYDGQTAFSAIINSTKNCDGRKLIKIIPNPVVNKIMQVYLNGFEKGVYKLLLFNSINQVCVTGTVNIGDNGIAQKNIETGQLTGVYILKILGADGNMVASEKVLLK